MVHAICATVSRMCHNKHQSTSSICSQQHALYTGERSLSSLSTALGVGMSLIGLGLYSHSSQQQRYVRKRADLECVEKKSTPIYIGDDDNSKALHKPLLS